MPDVEAVIAELAERARKIPDLNVYEGQHSSISTPALITGFPAIDFDLTMQRGSDFWRFTPLLLVSLASEEGAHSILSAFLSPAGDYSIRQAVDGLGTLVHHWSVDRFRDVKFYEVGGAIYFGGYFDITAPASGS